MSSLFSTSCINNCSTVVVDELFFIKLGASLWLSKSAASLLSLKRRFAGMFGCLPHICAIMFEYLRQMNEIQWPLSLGIEPKHLLWALLFLKRYNTEEINLSIVGCDEKTFRKWTWKVIEGLSKMSVVS